MGCRQTNSVASTEATVVFGKATMVGVVRTTQVPAKGRSTRWRDTFSSPLPGWAMRLWLPHCLW